MPLGVSGVQEVTLPMRLTLVDMLDRHWLTPLGELMKLPSGKVVPACASSQWSCRNTIKSAGVQVIKDFSH